MPIETKYLESDRGVVLSLSGAIQGDQLLSSMSNVFGDEKHLKLKYMIGDNTDCTQYLPDADAIEKVASLTVKESSRNPELLLAFISPTDFLYGMTRVFIAHCQECKFKIQVFRNRDDAETWVHQKTECEIKEEALIQKADDAARELLGQAFQDAIVLLQQATKIDDSGAADKAAKALMRQAVEVAKGMVHEATEKAKELISIAAEEATTLLARVNQLEGLIPICMNCKKIRDDESIWQDLESYISDHSDAQFSHGICPECDDKFRRDMGLKKNKRIKQEKFILILE